MQQAAHLVHEVITGGAVARPVGRQVLAGGEDLFQVQAQAAGLEPALAAGRIQPAAQLAHVAGGIGEAIDMVDAQAIQMAFGHQPQRQRMHRVEHCRQLHPQRHQRGDVEEAAVVEHVVAHAPPVQAVGLAFDQLVQAAVAALGTVVVVAQPLRARRGFRHVEGLRTDRVALVVMRQRGRAIVIQHQRDQAVGQCVGIGPVEHRQPQLAVAARGAPIDVEPVGVLGAAAVAQHIPPPRVLRVRGHVVGHDVGDQAHVVRACGL